MRSSLAVAVLVVVACASLSSVQADYASLVGVWSTVTVQSLSGCRHDIQFLHRNYIDYNTGPQCSSIGMYAGTFALAGTDELYIQFATSPVEGLSLQRDRYSISGNTLTLTVNLGTPYEGTLVFYKQTAAALDGVWDGVSSFGLTQRMQWSGGLYLAYSSGAGSTGGYYGLVLPTDSASLDTAAHVNITYARADPSSGIAAGTVLGAGITSSASSIVLTLTQPVTQTITFATKRSASVLDGTYVGINNNCFDTVEINKGLFRSYLLGCADPTNNLALMGPCEVNATHLTINYAFSPEGFALAKQIIPFPYTVSGDTLTLSVGGGSSNFVLKKVETAPQAQIVTITLAGELTTFTTEREKVFLEALAAALGVSPANLIITAKAAGSIVLTVVVVDDQSAGVSAATQVSTLASLTTIGNFSVQAVDVPSSTGGSVSLSTGASSSIGSSSTTSTGTTTGTSTATTTGTGTTGDLGAASRSHGATVVSVAAAAAAAAAILVLS